MRRRVEKSYTRYLAVRSSKYKQWGVSISDDSPISILQAALSKDTGLRYSPILPAYLAPNQAPPPIPAELESIAFFFSRRPYNALGRMKPILSRNERGQVYFTQGLASILCVNCDLPRAQELCKHTDNQLLEYWPLKHGELDSDQVIIVAESHKEIPDSLVLPIAGADRELLVYVEQIYACIASLRWSYRIYNPEELPTLVRLAQLTDRLVQRHRELSKRKTRGVDESLANIRKSNAVSSALIELGASLSYAVTQGTSGCSPILSNPSPFPHLSLLGVGGAVRALTKFTRYLESAFIVRDASDVIKRGYSCRKTEIPRRISVYNSGHEYKFSQSGEKFQAEFDRGGEFEQKGNVPLIVYLSLRHGFKESKFSLTAAAETLTDEVSPQWTIMTLSHEIMHNRVRQIFQALFGTNWDSDTHSVISQQYYDDFKEWYEAKPNGPAYDLERGIRNAVLNFCLAMARADDIRPVRRSDGELGISHDKLNEIYCRFKLRATELFVHFHDYYFTYACQPMIYTMSLWGSWIKVAAPYTKPMDYLVRTLATIACGTGLDPGAAFDQASERLEDALSALERSGVSSPLFREVRNLLKDPKALPYFKASYYLMDQVSRFFSSRVIASKIDRIEDDPFAEGSTSVEEYSATVFAYGESGDKGFVSPIRYSLASLATCMRGQSPIKDHQWLTAWNTLVISSQEVPRC